MHNITHASHLMFLLFNAALVMGVFITPLMLSLNVPRWETRYERSDRITCMVAATTLLAVLASVATFVSYLAFIQ